MAMLFVVLEILVAVFVRPPLTAGLALAGVLLAFSACFGVFGYYSLEFEALRHPVAVRVRDDGIQLLTKVGVRVVPWAEASLPAGTPWIPAPPNQDFRQFRITNSQQRIGMGMAFAVLAPNQIDVIVRHPRYSPPGPNDWTVQLTFLERLRSRRERRETAPMTDSTAGGSRSR